MAETWHQLFDPRHFLARVDIDRLIKHNEVRNENLVDQLEHPCILCGGLQSPGLLLNDFTYLCKPCLENISKITYPEKYELLWRDYLKNGEARSAALNALIDHCPSRKLAISAAMFGWLSLLLFFVKPILLLVPVILFLIHRTAKENHKKKVKAWDSTYPAPIEPSMRHFHDPQAELSRRDRVILKVFNKWPGYPPFWNYLRDVVLHRDDHRCQVSGCPSRVELHIHHIKPVSQGGEHVPSNLVTLCAFHHALEPDEGHERVWGEIKTKYFTMVQAHTRRNPSSPGRHAVCAHLRRLELVNESELSEILEFYGLTCAGCGQIGLDITVEGEKQRVTVICPKCLQIWTGQRGLSEETGPRLAEILNVTRHPGSWQARWEMLERRADSTFRLMSKSKPTHGKQKRKTIRSRKPENPICPKCGSPMQLIKPSGAQHWSAFWGCTKFRTKGCRGVIKA